MGNRENAGESIYGTLHNNIKQNNTLKLPANAFPNLQDLFNTYFDGPLVVAAVTLTQIPGGAKIAGSGTGIFNITSVVALFTGDPTAVKLELTATGVSGWQFSEAFPAMAGTVIDKYTFDPATPPALTLSSTQENPLSFRGDLQMSGLIQDIEHLLGDQVKLDLSGSINMKHGIPELDLKSDNLNPLTVDVLKDLPLVLGLESMCVPYSSPGTRETQYAVRICLYLSSSIEVVAGAPVPLRVEFVPYSNEVTFSADLTKAGRLALEDLGQWVHGADLGGVFKKIASQFNPTTGLQPKNLEFVVTTTAPPALVSVSALLETDNSWTIVPGYLTVDAPVAMQFTLANLMKDPPQIMCAIAATCTLGDPRAPIAKVDLMAGYSNDFAMYGELTPNTVVELGPLLEKFVDGTVHIPTDLAITDFAFSAEPVDSAYTMLMGLEGHWPIPVGKSNLSVTDIWMQIDTAGSNGASVQAVEKVTPSGAIGGTIELDADISFTISYIIPNELQIDGVIAKIALSKLIHALCNHIIDLPADFDPEITNATVCIQTQGTALSFATGGELNKESSIVFEARKNGEQWGFAIGIVTTAKGILDLLPGLKNLLDTVALGDPEKPDSTMLLAISSATIPGFSFPDNLPVQAKLPAQAQGTLSEGLTFYARLDLKGKAATSKLQKLLGLTIDSVDLTLDISIPPETNSKLTAGFDVDIPILGTRKNKNNIYIAGCTLGAEIIGGNPQLSLAGNFQGTIEGRQMSGAVGAQLTAEAVFVYGELDGTVSFLDVDLSGLTVELGLDWEGVPSLGLTGSISASNFSSSIAMFFNTGDPAQSMFMGSVSDISLADIATTLAAQGAGPNPILAALKTFRLAGTQKFNIPITLKSDLNARKVSPDLCTAFGEANPPIQLNPKSTFLSVGTLDEKWFIVDMTVGQQASYELTASDKSIVVSKEAQVYFVPEATMVGQNLFNAGVKVSGSLSLLKQTMNLDVEIMSQKGILIEDQFTDPIVIVDTNFLSITDATDNKRGPGISLLTYERDGQSPHFQLSGQLSLLGVAGTCADIDIEAKGIRFSFGSDVDGVTCRIHGSFTGLTNMSAGGTVDFMTANHSVDLGVLGKLNLPNLHIAGNVNLTFNGNTATASITHAHFAVGQHAFKLKIIELSVSGASLKTLDKTLVTKADALIKEFAEEVSQWLTWYRSRIVGSVKPGYVLGKGYFHEGATDIVSQCMGILTITDLDTLVQILWDAQTVTAWDAAYALYDTEKFTWEAIWDVIEKIFTDE